MISMRAGVVRQSLRLTQAALAKELGITLNQVANVVAGYTPLSYAIGRHLCERFNISQRWLAVGGAPMNSVVKIPKRIEAQIPAGALFSQAYDEHLAAIVEGEEKRRRSGERTAFEAAGGTPEKAAEHYAGLLKTIWFDRVSILEQDELYRRLSSTAAEWWHARGKTKGRQPPGRKPSAGRGPRPVNPQAEAAVTALKKIAVEMGGGASLARDLGVSRQAVALWMSGRARPAGAMLQRVQDYLKARAG